MMKETGLKYIFYVLSAFLLILMLLTSRDAGITCDEVLHYNQSESVYKYFASHGENKSALDTPVTNLKYYGQSYDNIVTILIHWLNINDVYGFRHVMSSLAGWLVILLTALFAIWLTGYRTGIIVLILFALSPTFIGHTQNNLKDIPFALAYIAAVFYTLKFLVSGRKITFHDVFFLTAGITFSISLRAGGLILICYLFFFFFLYFLFYYLKDKKIDIKEIRIKLFWITGISIISWLLSTLLWPYALQSPVKHVLESYRIMAHFPDTFRQIFEGKVEWSDYMPWYYLPVSMGITIPLIVLSGLLLFFLFSKHVFKNRKAVLYAFIVFSLVFPVLFVIYEKSNIYSSWRQFLFVYPVIIILAATGFTCLFEKIKRKYFLWGSIAIFVLLAIHPFKFMVLNHHYYYLYYNQLVGGLKGAYGNYEGDYYYVSQTEASEWLIDYIKSRNIKNTIKVKATYSVQWQFRKHPEIENSYFRYEERSLSDWDYAIVVNRYISPFQLKNKTWPPENAIHVIYADGIPVCAVLERRSKDDFNGYCALKENRYEDAVKYYEKAISANDKDEMIFFNFAAALYNSGDRIKADSVLKKGLKINPEFEPVLMYLGNIARAEGRKNDAIMYYEKVIKVNRKYFEAYVGLSELLTEKDVMQARKLLRSCLVMSPRYKPAIIALADTYRKSDPDIARKYDELAKTIK
jgi:tetratricopeptide (TPR) repeat protein